MKFKEQRIEDEFNQLNIRNANLKSLLLSLEQFIKAECNKEMTITSIYRTPEENQAVGAVSAVHVVWHAADVSINDYTNQEQGHILEFCKAFTYRGTAGKPVGLIHTACGGAPHLHLQYF